MPPPPLSLVAPEIQQLFDKISSIFTECRWHENTMVVLEEYVILPPYGDVLVLPGKEGGGLARIQMIVSVPAAVLYSNTVMCTLC
ncbi:hypothetical protein EON64_06715 [archaeon]|nr:MAG: hypothetical protein EON64_06715 [archaeon]